MSDVTRVGSISIDVGLDFTRLTADFARLQGVINGQTTAMAKGMDKVGKSAKAAGTSAATAGKKVTKSFEQSLASALSLERVLSRIAFIATVGAMFTLGRALQTSLRDGEKDAIEFEKALAHINTVLDDSAKHYLPEFKKGIESLALGMGVSVKELSASMYDIISARIPADNALYVLNEITKLAIGNQAELRTVTQAVVGVMNAYNYTALEATAVTDKLQATVKYGRMELQDMAGTLGRVTSAAAALGISLDDVLGSLATMTRQGMNARESVTALRRMLLKLSEDAQLSAKIQKEGLLSVIPIMELMTVKQKVMFAGGIRGFNAAIIAMKNFASQGKTVEEILTSDEEAAKAFGIEMETTGKKLDIEKERWRAVWRAVGANTAGLRADLLNFATNLSVIVLGLADLGNIALNIVPAGILELGKLVGLGDDFNVFGQNVAGSAAELKAFYNAITGNIDPAIEKLKEMQKAFSYMPLDTDTIGEPEINSDLTKRKEDLILELALQKSIYDKAVSGGAEAKNAAQGYIRTWEKLNTVLDEVAVEGAGWQQLTVEANNSTAALNNFINGLNKVKESLKGATKEEILADNIKDATNALRENISILDLHRQLGRDTHKEMVDNYDNAIKKLKALGLARDEYVIKRLELERDLLLQVNKAQATPDASGYQAWLDEIMKVGDDVQRYWAKYANTIIGISGKTTDNIIENWKEVYDILKEKSPEQAEMFKEMVGEMDESFDLMEATVDSFVSGVSSGYMDMIRDILDGANMMKKKWGDYFKEMANTFIYELNRMLIEWLAFQAITGILGLLFPGSKVATQAAFAGAIGGVGAAPATPSIQSIGIGGYTPTVPEQVINALTRGSSTGGASSTINNFNPSFSPNNNINATFSQRDMGFIYRQGKRYTQKTSL